MPTAVATTKAVPGCRPEPRQGPAAERCAAAGSSIASSRLSMATPANRGKSRIAVTAAEVRSVGLTTFLL